jgi:hypothetical protein
MKYALAVFVIWENQHLTLDANRTAHIVDR